MTAAREARAVEPATPEQSPRPAAANAPESDDEEAFGQVVNCYGVFAASMSCNVGARQTIVGNDVVRPGEL